MISKKRVITIRVSSPKECRQHINSWKRSQKINDPAYQLHYMSVCATDGVVRFFFDFFSRNLFLTKCQG